MKRPNSIDSKELGLAAGYIFGRYFFKTEHLHYGYWPDDLPVDISNLSRAQELYCDILLSHVPSETESILDVGCGSGIFSRRMIEEGYRVECVSPSPFLSAQAREILGDEKLIHQSTFENLSLDRKFDLLLFAESFQYIDPNLVFSKCHELLTERGCVLIFDFFRRENATGASGMGGGHSLKHFYENLEAANFIILTDSDLTSRTAPTIDLISDLLNSVGKPLWELFFQYFDSNCPRTGRLARWRYRKKIEKLEKKYFSGRRNAENFAEDKSYRLVLCRPGKGSVSSV